MHVVILGVPHKRYIICISSHCGWAYPWRVNLWRYFLLFLEVYIYLFHGVLAWQDSKPLDSLYWGLTTSSCSSIHLVGCLVICTCELVAYILRITFYFLRLVMEMSLEGIFCCYISQAPQRSDFVSPSRWTIEHILLD